MPDFHLGPQDILYYEYEAPKAESGFTFIFFNALTSATNNWETIIGPKLREAGHGTLAYNLRGQINSKFSPELKLDVDLIVDDAIVNSPQVMRSAPQITAVFLVRHLP